MNAASKAGAFDPVDKAAFLRFIATEPEGRYEFEGGRIVQQMAGTLVHYRIAQRFQLALLGQLDAAVWHVFTDWGVEPAETIRYGDVVVSPTSDRAEQLWTNAPAIIVEILSPSSIARDLDFKPTEYLALPSLEAYVVASQTEPACLAWIRDHSRRFPAEPRECASSETIEISALDVTIPIEAIYQGIELPPQDAFPHG